MDERLDSFGRAVRARRKEMRLTQEQLAERAGLHPNSISLIERGQTNAGLDVLFAIADALDIAAATLVNAAETARTKGRRGRRG